MKMKETLEDISVKDRLRAATKAEVMRFAGRYAEEHIKGERVSDGQEGVACAAKMKGYPKGLIRDMGSLVRRGLSETEKADEALASWWNRINL